MEEITKNWMDIENDGNLLYVIYYLYVIRLIIKLKIFFY